MQSVRADEWSEALRSRWAEAQSLESGIEGVRWVGVASSVLIVRGSDSPMK